jgi:hypothetical protein
MEKIDKVAVVTLNYNQSIMTIECVNSILKSNYNNFIVLLIDNGSTEDNYQILFKEYANNNKIILIRIIDNVGYVKGVNRGIEEALKISAEYIQIMNNDTLIDPEAISVLVEECQRHNNKAIVSGKVFHYDRPETLQYIGHYFKDRRFLSEIFPGRNEKDIGQFDVVSERDMLDDIFWLLPQKVVEDVGFYNPYFFLYAEQADYALRSVKKGYKLIYTPLAKLWHKGSITTGAGERNSPVVNFWRFKSSFIYLYIHTKKIHFAYSISRRIILLSKNFLKFKISGNISELKSTKAAFVGNWYGFKWLINKVEDNGFNPYLDKR